MLRSVIIGVSLVFVLSAQAQGGDPAAIVAGLYKDNATDACGWSRRIKWSGRMGKLWAAECQLVTKRHVGNLDFDFVSDSQDPDVKNLRICFEPTRGKAETVDVNFMNGGKPDHLQYVFIEERGQWALDEVRGLSNNWVLSKVLAGK